jgi:hypothetical protein
MSPAAKTSPAASAAEAEAGTCHYTATSTSAYVSSQLWQLEFFSAASASGAVIRPAFAPWP